MQNLLASLTRFRKRVFPRSPCLISRQSSQCLTPTPVAVFQPLAIRISRYDNTRIFAIVPQVRQSIVPLLRVNREKSINDEDLWKCILRFKDSGHFRMKCSIKCCMFCFLNMNFIDTMKLRYLES